MKENFDELQVRNRQRIAYQTMFFMLIMLLINGIIKEFFIGEWASPMVEANIMIVLPALYFVSACIWKNAYFTEIILSTDVIMVIFMLGGLASVVASFTGDRSFIVDNMLMPVNILLITGIFFLLISIQYWLKRVIDKKKYKDE